MSSENYFLVKTTSIVKAPNMAKAKAIAAGADDHGHLLNQKIEIEEKNELDVGKIVSKFDDKYVFSKYQNDDAEEDELDSNDYSSSFVSVNEDLVNFLRTENKRLARLADKHKNVKEDALASVYQAAYEAFSNFELPKIEYKKSYKSSSKSAPETAVAVFADWQLGKVTSTYNSEVLARRIELYTQKMLEIVEIQRHHHNVDRLHVWLLGDIVEGEEIFPGQSHLLDAGLYRQVGIYGPEILTKFITESLQHFEHIHITGVIGNHGAVGGRARKQHDPETNMDRLLYKIVSWIFKDEPRVTFDIPDGRGERSFYAVDRIGDYSTLLIHGDQMPSPTAFHGYFKKVMGWKDGAIEDHFDDVFMGHYHQQVKVTIGSGLLRISGSPESNNTYAQEYFSSMSRPCQHLMFVHPQNGVTSEYSIWLDGV